jgi:hypothetical protein
MLRRTAALSLVIAAGCGRSSQPVTTAPTPTVASTPTPPPPPAPPVTFIPTTSDARMTRVIDLREGTTKAQAFKVVSDYLTQSFLIDVSDPRAGFLMTTWQNSSVRDGAPDLHYRTRLIIRIGEDGKQASIRAEANWQRGDEWDIGYDTRVLEDAIVELRTRIGKTTGL